jgi:hypothetical protein
MKTPFARFLLARRSGFGALHPLATLFLFLLLTACHQEKPVTPSRDRQPPDPAQYSTMRISFHSLEGEWLLTNYKLKPLPQDLQNQATLILKKQTDERMQIGGRSFVNLYGGSFSLDETKGLLVSAEPVMQTLIGGSPQQMEAEGRHLNDLEKVQYFEIDSDGRLNLYIGKKDHPATEVMICTKK